jgi:hypothetical protein
MLNNAAAEERHLYVPLLMEDGGLDASRHALRWYARGSTVRQRCSN